MQWLRFAVLVVVAALIQASLVGKIAFSSLNIQPDLLFILVVFFAIYTRTADAIIESFIIGLAADLISGGSMGPKILSFGIVGTAIAYLNSVIAIKKYVFQASTIFISAIVAGLLAAFLNYLKDVTGQTFTALLGGSLYSGIIGPFIFKPSLWLLRIKQPRRKGFRL